MVTVSEGRARPSRRQYSNVEERSNHIRKSEGQSLNSVARNTLKLSVMNVHNDARAATKSSKISRTTQSMAPNPKRDTWAVSTPTTRHQCHAIFRRCRLDGQVARGAIRNLVEGDRALATEDVGNLGVEVALDIVIFVITKSRSGERARDLLEAGGDGELGAIDARASHSKAVFRCVMHGQCLELAIKVAFSHDNGNGSSETVVTGCHLKGDICQLFQSQRGNEVRGGRR